MLKNIYTTNELWNNKVSLQGMHNTQYIGNSSILNFSSMTRYFIFIRLSHIPKLHTLHYQSYDKDW